MSFMKLPKCPYCGKELSYRETWRIRKYGDYECDRCHQEYKIRYSRSVYFIVIGLLALEGFIFFTFDGINGKLNLFTMILMIAPLLLLYPILPLMMSLRRKKGRGPHPATQPQRDRQPGGTRIYQPGTHSGQGYVSGNTGHPGPNSRPGDRRPGPVPRPGMEPARQRRPAAQNRPMERPAGHMTGQEVRKPSRPPFREGERNVDRPLERREAVRGQERDERRRRPYPGEASRVRPASPEQRRGETRPPERRRPYVGRHHPSRSDGRFNLQKKAQAFFASAGHFFQKAGGAVMNGLLVAASYAKIGALWTAGKIKAGALWVAAALSGLWSTVSARLASGAQTGGKSVKERNGRRVARRDPYMYSEHSPRRRPEAHLNGQGRFQGEPEQNRRTPRPTEDRRASDEYRRARPMESRSVPKHERDSYSPAKEEPRRERRKEEFREDVLRPEFRRDRTGHSQETGRRERTERDGESRSQAERYRNSVSQGSRFGDQGRRRPPR